MRRSSIWAMRVGLAALATCGLATCQHRAPGPSIQPVAPREVPPLGPQPGPTAPIVAVPESHAGDPATAPRAGTPVPVQRQTPTSACPGQPGCPDAGAGDGGVPPVQPAPVPPPAGQAPSGPGESAELGPGAAPLEASPAQDENSVRMSIAPPRPPTDAGVDAIVPLPPIPDAGVLHDAAQPMR